MSTAEMMVMLFNKRAAGLHRVRRPSTTRSVLDPDFPKAGKAPASCGSPSQAIRTIELLSSQTDVLIHQYLTQYKRTNECVVDTQTKDRKHSKDSQGYNESEYNESNQ